MKLSIFFASLIIPALYAMEQNAPRDQRSNLPAIQRPPRASTTTANTPLDLAIHKNNPAMVQLLLAFRAQKTPVSK